jgi:hypothetical protein
MDVEQMGDEIWYEADKRSKGVLDGPLLYDLELSIPSH